MVEPRVIPRAEHSLSRKDMDQDALRVLYRLRQHEHTAYLVGGSVRDLLLGRKPKDFDIGTSAHPYQVKKLFRNCWIIGRRFRLAHVKFGPKVIEVATFRRQVPAGEETVHAEDGGAKSDEGPPPETSHDHHLLVHRDNTFGTAEEDAFRRDFTINALFYDIATFAIIDYVGGLDDLRARLVRSIGDPLERFREDPVRMLRAVALGARLDFELDPPVLEAIGALRHEIARSSPARMIEELYKILRTGSAQPTFKTLATVGLLEPIAPELGRAAGDPLWTALSNLDRYRRAFEASPDTLSNAILLGSLLVPAGFAPQSHRHDSGPQEDADKVGRRRRTRTFSVKLGAMPLARRDLERLEQILGLQRRLLDVHASPRAQMAVVHRSIFREALTWLEIHGDRPDLIQHWKVLGENRPEGQGLLSTGDDGTPFRRRRRRRRRRRGPRPLPQ